MNDTTHPISDGLLQAISDILNEMPAKASRHVLNALEAEVQAENQRRVQESEKAARYRIADEVLQERAKASQPAPALQPQAVSEPAQPEVNAS